MQFNTCFILGVMVGLLSGCSKKKEILQGERESIIKIQKATNAEKADIAVALPAPIVATEWNEPYGPLGHGEGPLFLPGLLQFQTETSISMAENPALQTELISNGKQIVVLDGQGNVSARDHTNPGLIKWEFSIVPEKTNISVLGGGISCDNQSVYIGSPYGEIICLNSTTGAVRWRQALRNPSRTAPILKGNYGIILTINNEIEAFALNTGKHLWTHRAIIENAGSLKTNPPIISENVVIVVYSSGEMYALRLENGHPLWSYSLSNTQHLDARSLLTPIMAHSVVHKGYIFVMTQNNKLTCIHLWSGKKVWEKNIPDIGVPTIAGDFLYGIVKNQQLICLHGLTGQEIWAKPLLALEEIVQWTRPVVFNTEIFIANTAGQGKYYSAIDGHWVKDIELSGSIALTPLVVNDTIFFLNNEGNLSQWKAVNLKS